MSIFEFFFKYQPIIYAKGHLAFQLLGSRAWFILFIAAAGAGAYYAYRRVARDKYSIGLVVLRGITFTVADRARVPIIALRYGLPLYFAPYASSMR